MYLIDLSKPSLKLLQKAKVITAVSAKWYQLGIELLEDEKVGHLQNIKANNNNDVTGCCYAMFSYWIQTQPKASWHQLAHALSEPGVEMNGVAETVKERFIGLCRVDICAVYLISTCLQCYIFYVHHSL